MKDSELKALDELLDRLVTASENTTSDLATKIDLLERLLHSWRFAHNRPDNDLPFEEYLQYEIFADTDKISFKRPSQFQSLGSGVPPIRLQPTLLMYLLASHSKHRKVLGVIDGYVEQIRSSLGELDFKKTKTGVTRCYTNTRFAANTLRDYGFLKFTQKEAFKVWVLSLPGFIVASKVFEANDWTLKVIDKEKNYDLHPVIRSAWDSFDGFDKFYDQLVSACCPNIELFETFGPVLRKAYNILTQYWKALNNSDISQKDRKAQSLELLKEIEALPRMNKFYSELSTSVNVNKFVDEMKKAAKESS
jgi:hypothetical protein